jgi:micrococcal nuclease
MNGELIQFPKTCSICDQYSQSFQEIEQSSSCFKKEYICQDCIDVAEGIDILENKCLKVYRIQRKFILLENDAMKSYGVKIFLSSLLFVSNIANADFVARVIGVTDGDTITVLDRSNNQIKVRLADIDAPEKSQPFGVKAKQALSDLTFNRNVYIQEKGYDKYHRLIGTVLVGVDPINRIMVKNGMAWAFREYLDDPIMLDLESYARKNKIGLWQDAKPVYPSMWRKNQSQ